ncbi:hypothetical protein [Nitratireductor rhodophyticola]
MSNKKPFEVTEKAGAFVAGIRSPGAGKTLQLTEEQARYPLILGELRQPEKKPQEAKPATASNTKARKD